MKCSLLHNQRSAERSRELCWQPAFETGRTRLTYGPITLLQLLGPRHRRYAKLHPVNTGTVLQKCHQQPTCLHLGRCQREPALPQGERRRLSVHLSWGAQPQPPSCESTHTHTHTHTHAHTRTCEITVLPQPNAPGMAHVPPSTDGNSASNTLHQHPHNTRGAHPRLRWQSACWVV